MANLFYRKFTPCFSLPPCLIYFALIVPPAFASTQDAKPKLFDRAACFEDAYAISKKAYDEKTRLPAPILSVSKEDIARDKTGKGRVITLNSRLPYPPEIARIQRGMIKSFSGAFINDGMDSWQGIDLDRMESISVYRRTYMKKAKSFTKPFNEPVFLKNDETSFVRKFSNDELIEMEIVRRSHADISTLVAFTCIANGAWKSSPIDWNQVTPPSDSFGSIVLLFDRQKEGDDNILYRRRVDEFPFDAVIKSLNEEMWKYTWQ